MKKNRTYLVLCFLLFVCVCSVSAQTEPVAPKSPYRNSKVYTSNLSIDGATLDKRIAKYYQESDLLAMKARKVNQLNYVYLKSFTVIHYESLSADVKKFIDESFDIGLYEKYRKADSTAIVEVDMDGKKFSVELFSRNEVLKTKESIQ
jgi:hypothetical protein